ncbi:MAG: protease modulator HflC [Gammaproteobacteria bacterium]|nr:protease modulator HflC [Gammaproteobacteria bacterium]MCP4091118.1 protease modulator HflC [Gammaproteobacteria bacterium]MCP4277356.1 protease modulator HflC [Gammaproteobacteria bacterium]MCP4831583.1 protease modulator HflC [Gammaproteobacteria bacterium]MCP4927806.1 protease modulator HflC [Gammaproteobacteria bacterium]
MKNSSNALILLVAIAALILYGSVFTVGERDLAIKFRFSEIVASDYEPGLHWKMPYINSYQLFPKRLQTINNPQEQFLTKEKKNLYVDFFVKWRIVDIEQYYKATSGDAAIAAQRLLSIVKDGIRGEFAKRTVPEVVSSERREIMGDMLENARVNAVQLGILVVDVRVKRIEFSDTVSESVFKRMREERLRVAAELRAEGAENAERIRAEADRGRTVILAEAYRDSEIIRGEGDAFAAEIYAKAYKKDPEFYSFSRSIDAYKSSLGNQSDLLVLSPDSDFLRYLNQAKGK